MSSTSTTTEQTTLATPARRRRRFAGWIFAVIGVAGFSGSLFAWWALYGTTIQAEQAADVRMEEFTAAAPSPAPGTPVWRTDIDNLPDPVDTSELDSQTAFGILHVPIWSGRTRGAMPIMEGTGDRVLNQAAAGHYLATAGPGEVGNFGLAAHRRTKGNSFRYLPDLKTGDLIIVETAQVWLRYEVTDYEIVMPTDGAPLLPVPGDAAATPTQRLITLSTCTGPDGSQWSNTRRWMTHGELTGWMPRTDGVPAEVSAIGRS